MGVWGRVGVVVVVAVAVCGVGVTRAQGDSTNLLRWAPLHLRSPYLTFLNDFYNPSWRTRNSFSKQPEALRHLELPRDVPFSLVCGACFERSKVKTNLTVSMSGGLEHLSVPKTHGHLGSVQKYRVGHLDCMMSYLITAPLKQGGKITCTLRRGKQQKTEVISFSVAAVKIQEPPEEVELHNDQQTVTLNCPTLPSDVYSKQNPPVYVWHDSDDPTGAAIPYTKPSVTLRRPQNSRHITCSVYTIARPSASQVYRSRYQVAGTKAPTQEYRVSGPHDEPQGHEVLLEEDGSQKQTSGLGISTTMLVVLVAAALVGSLLLIVGIYKLVAAARAP